jgi:hypothetical protein
MKRVLAVLIAAVVLCAALLLLFSREDDRISGPEAAREEKSDAAYRAGRVPSGMSPAAPGVESQSTGGDRAAGPSTDAGESGAGSKASASGAPEGKGADGPRDVSLRGRVVFGRDRVPLPGVLVLLMKGMGEKGRILTRADGGFEFVKSREGAWSVCAQPWGECWPIDSDIPGGGRAPAFLEITVPDALAMEIWGTVTAPDGRPLAGASVSVQSGQSGDEEHATTFADGSYRIAGFTPRLPKPLPRPTLSDEIEVWFWRDRNDLRNLRVTFSHPSFPAGAAGISPSLEKPSVVRVDHRFGEGVVSGTVRVPAGGKVDGERIPCSVSPCEDMSLSFPPPAIEGNRFQLRTREVGTLRLGPGFVGEFWLDAVEVGSIGPGVVREGIELELARVATHSIALLDLEGAPLDPEDVQVRAWWSSTWRRWCDLSVEDSRLRVPQFPGGRSRLHLSGYGFFWQVIDLDAASAPTVVRLETLPPILRGRIEFPAGFEERDKVRLALRATEDGRPMPKDWSFLSPRGPGVEGSWIDKETGEFRILCYAPGGANSLRLPEAIAYSVSLAIPDHRPWKLDDVPLKRDLPPRYVTVRFEK